MFTTLEQQLKSIAEWAVETEERADGGRFASYARSRWTAKWLEKLHVWAAELGMPAGVELEHKLKERLVGDGVGRSRSQGIDRRLMPGRMLRTRLQFFSDLVAQLDSECTDPEFRADRLDQGILDLAEVKRITREPITFLETMIGRDGSLAKRERNNESSRHRDLVQEMVGMLIRAGYRVYPGGVGVQGIYTCADLLAIDEDKSLLFVEVLTAAAIKQGSHRKKLPLAERVPMCFVGPLPKDVRLPAQSYTIEHPRSPRMLDGRWVPLYQRKRGAEIDGLDANVVRSRKVVRGTVELPGLRLPEDVSAILWAGISHGIGINGTPTSDIRAYDKPQLDNWTLSTYFPRPTIPYDPPHRRASVFRAVNGSASLRIKLADDENAWASFEARGDDAFDFMINILSEASLPLRVRSVRR